MASGRDAASAPIGEHAVRDRILDVTVDLLGSQGAAALSTRAVCRAAGVQAPTIYRIFGHKDGLVEAAAAHGFAGYARDHAVGPPCADPVDGLRRGWNLHIGFALEHPALYVLTYGHPRPGPLPAAAAHATLILGQRISRVASAGRLRVAEKHAVQLFRSAACGTALTLIGTPAEHRDLALSELARESVLLTITTGPAAAAQPDVISAALQVRSALSEMAALTERERGLLEEWIDRISARPRPDPDGTG